MVIDLAAGVAPLMRAMGESAVTTRVRPRRLRVATVGRALSATADYA